MSLKSREVKVLAAFMSSMTVGVLVLMALANEPPSAGAFCLSGYYDLDSIDRVISSQAQPSVPWNQIAVFYSGTKSGNVQQLALLGSATNTNHTICPCHFVVCNGFGGADGDIQPTEQWRRQRSITTAGEAGTIHICVVGDGQHNRPTDLQIKRAEALIAALCRQFGIEPESVGYPGDWW
ncbi:MAG: peptidoglycan recognition protein family protein [Planctomycetota bacterium]